MLYNTERKNMKTIQTSTQKLQAWVTLPRRRSGGPLSVALCLIISVLLVACSGGSTPPDQAADTAAASLDSATGQEDASATQGDEEEDEEEEDEDEDEDEEGSAPGTEEFGLTEEELVTKIESVESLIAKCMSDAGFEYVPVDYLTVRQAMDADKTIAGLGDEEYAAQFGYGISTQVAVADLPPQLADPTTPATIGLGKQNIQIFNSLSAADQAAYNRTLFGENADETFAVALEAEDFSQTGGCTRAAVEQVFNPKDLSVAYSNPKDALIEQDPRVIAAVADWAECMREAGFDYNNPEEIEPDLEDQLDAILDDADPKTLSVEAQAALTELQGEEKAIAVADLDCEAKYIVPAVQQVETELYGGPQN
jgi:hypothetical protein